MIESVLKDAATEWSGTVYRAVDVRYSNRSDIITGEGSRLWGQRWNPKGIAAVYGALKPELAVREALQKRLRAVDELVPLVLVAIDVRLTKIVDLSAARVLEALQATRQELLDEDWIGTQIKGEMARTQRLGQVAFEMGLSGLLVPSARSSRGRNLVVFPMNLSSNEVLRVQRSDLLPSND